MKNKLNIFSEKKINFFLLNLLSDYNLSFMNFNDLHNYQENSQANIIILNNNKEANLVNFQKLNENNLILCSLNIKNLNLKKKIKLLKCPLPINNIKNIIEIFVQNLKIQFHDVILDNEKLINLNNKSFCYLTKVEIEILSYLLREKETSKNFVKENILNIKSNVETNALESHLTRIRKKMNRVSTTVKIRAKNEKLIVTI
ncbi:helix-turn-helix domain-containing protein [Pelagibacteraceae bacterium]|nr:helix-turn-helix domain-containing protein [Pelagibacteraceae bacterium]